MRRSLIVVVAMVVSCAVLLGSRAPTQGSDPINGTWKLNLAKSTFSPGPPRRRHLSTSESFRLWKGAGVFSCCLVSTRKGIQPFKS